MSHLDRLARRALCLHSEGAAAPLATHRTQAPAARKGGGGPAHFQPVNAMPLGRQPLPEGGEIDSLCRAAAGIIPLITPLISAHNGAHAYPTEGVRRAQKMEPRSADHTSPAAQRDQGCKTSGELNIHLQLGEMLLSRSEQALNRNICHLRHPFHDRNLVRWERRRSQTRDDTSATSPEALANLYPSSSSFRVWQALDADFTQHPLPLLKDGGQYLQSGEPCLSLLRSSSSQVDEPGGMPTKTECKAQKLRLFVPLRLDLKLCLTIEDPYSRDDRCDRTNGLHPGGSAFCTPWQVEKPNKAEHSNWRYQPKPWAYCETHPDILRHHVNPVRSQLQASMPAAPLAVHGGAA